MNTLVSYLKNVRAEMQHVVWPDWKQAMWHTAIIILISAIVALFLAALDYGFQTAVTALLNRAG